MSIFLKAILVILFSCKLIADSGVFNYVKGTTKMFVEDKEEKTEKNDKEGKDKFSDEDKWFVIHHQDHQRGCLMSDHLYSIPTLAIYSRFIDKPHTPPPDGA